MDSASTDGTSEIAARLVAANPRLTVYREEKPGISVARNTALWDAHGQYVLFLDDDETAEPDWLAAYQRFLSVPPSEKIAVVGGAVLNEYEIPLPKWANTSGTFNHGNSPK